MGGIEWAIESYTAALGHVNDAACLIEDAEVVSVDVVVRQAPVRLIRALNDVYVDINRVLGALREAAPEK